MVNFKKKIEGWDFYKYPQYFLSKFIDQTSCNVFSIEQR